jgi:peptidoglycan hydrolase CwlO-like protein
MDSDDKKIIATQKKVHDLTEQLRKLDERFVSRTDRIAEEISKGVASAIANGKKTEKRLEAIERSIGEDVDAAVLEFAKITSGSEESGE